MQNFQDSADIVIDPKCNIQKQRLLQPSLDYQVNESVTPFIPASGNNRKASEKDISKLLDDDRRILKKVRFL